MQCFNADVADSNSGEGSGGSKHRTTNVSGFGFCVPVCMHLCASIVYVHISILKIIPCVTVCVHVCVCAFA